MMVMEEYSFRFHITDSYPLQNENDKIEAVVRTKIKHAERGCLYEGYLRVHITKIGVFPVAKDIAEAIGVRSLRQQLAAELKDTYGRTAIFYNFIQTFVQVDFHLQ